MYIPTKILLSILTDEDKSSDNKIESILTILKTKKRPDKKEIKAPTIKIEHKDIHIVF